MAAGVMLGAGISFAFASMANLIVGSVSQSEVGIATGINTVTRTVGGAFVISALGGVLAIAAALLVPSHAAGGVQVASEPAPA